MAVHYIAPLGYTPSPGSTVCPDCLGWGTVEPAPDKYADGSGGSLTCPTCNGTGEKQ